MKKKKASPVTHAGQEARRKARGSAASNKDVRGKVHHVKKKGKTYRVSSKKFKHDGAAKRTTTVRQVNEKGQMVKPAKTRRKFTTSNVKQHSVERKTPGGRSAVVSKSSVRVRPLKRPKGKRDVHTEKRTTVHHRTPSGKKKESTKTTLRKNGGKKAISKSTKDRNDHSNKSKWSHTKKAVPALKKKRRAPGSWRK
jgi:bifunctional DNA-binding transcriptional regulator/antitoxin component of YhaV-PrlF toxin-antitoxin module